jgi:hypothetical protein
MWDSVYGHVDKAKHMRAMFELTTRMNALARIVVGPANISATTALQVRARGGGGGGVSGADCVAPAPPPPRCSSAGAHVLCEWRRLRSVLLQ